MLLGDVLGAHRLGLVPLVAGESDRPVHRVHVTDLPDPGRYLAPGDLVLTGLMWHGGPADSERFVASLAAAGVAALGAGDARTGSVPADLVDACRRHAVPLFEVPVEVAFGDIVEAVDRARWAARARDLVTAVGRQRGLVSAMAAGAGLADLLPELAAELGLACWVLTPTGRVVAASAGASAGLPDGVAAELARGFLTAGRLPARVVAGGQAFTVLPVPGRAQHRLAGWILACLPAGPDVPPGAEDLAGMVALERAHSDQAAVVERRLAGQLSAALTGPGGAADVRAALASCGLAPAATLLAVVGTLTGLRAPATLGEAVVAEVVRTAVPDAAPAVAGLPDGGVLAVVAGPPDGAGAVPDRLRAAAAVLGAGLGPGGRLALGVSGPAAGAAALPGAVEEARHAARAAASGGADLAGADLAGAAGLASSLARGGGAVVVVSAADLAEHGLLLAGVPVEARRAYRRRLLGPIQEYDRAHGSDLLATLAAFLDSDGSWSRCAGRLHLHVNTLRYRIGRIERLTGRDLSRFPDRVDLYLALRLPD
jgi:hypothetical protein